MLKSAYEGLNAHPKCIHRKSIFAKCTQLACLLSFASLFLYQSWNNSNYLSRIIVIFCAHWLGHSDSLWPASKKIENHFQSRFPLPTSVLCTESTFHGCLQGLALALKSRKDDWAKFEILKKTIICTAVLALGGTIWRFNQWLNFPRKWFNSIFDSKENCQNSIQKIIQ